MATTLVLWDIDHTLIETRGVGGEVYAEAFRKVTGHPLEKMPELAGRTEPVIFRDALKVNGVNASEDLYQRFADEQARGYADHLDELRRRGRTLPGATEALCELSGRDDVAQSILTGNTRPSAEIKLRAFGLDRYLDFGIGAYGTDDDTRANLVGVARQRAEKVHSHRFDNGQTVLIGDTPNDGLFAGVIRQLMCDMASSPGCVRTSYTGFQGAPGGPLAPPTRRPGLRSRSGRPSAGRLARSNRHPPGPLSRRVTGEPRRI